LDQLGGDQTPIGLVGNRKGSQASSISLVSAGSSSLPTTPSSGHAPSPNSAQGYGLKTKLFHALGMKP
jgi:hypothetical protein